MQKRSLLLLFTVLILPTSCRNGVSPVEDEAAYKESVFRWQKERMESLRSPEGWLNLAGIFWLEEGIHTFGSDSSNDLIFPSRAPAFIGTLKVDDEHVHLEVNEDATLFYEGSQIHELDLEVDTSGSPSFVTHDDFAWYIMKRHRSIAVRLRDYQNPAIEALQEIPCYPVDPGYVVEATLHPFVEPRIITVNTPFQDYTQDYECPGELHFRLSGKKLKLLPFTSGEGYFLIFSDETSGLETYGAGRFMYCTPDSTGRILLDFNKAYNPPCAITPFAACPMPPPENFLPLAVKAGEKSLNKH